MAITKDNALHSILDHFNEMVGLVMRQLNIMNHLLADGIIDIPTEVQQEIEDNENRIDGFETSLGNEIIDIIALQNPVASDIRRIISAYQMISNLERIADQVKNIDKYLPRVEDRNVFSQMSGVISSMMKSSIAMVQKSVDAFVKDDNDAAVWTIKNDDVVDDISEMAQPNDFMFLDPPYDCVFSDYGNKAYRSDGFDEAAHRKLASDFLNLGCRALMVIGATPLIRELYGKFIVGEYDKNYSVNIRNRFNCIQLWNYSIIQEAIIS